MAFDNYNPQAQGNSLVGGLTKTVGDIGRKAMGSLLPKDGVPTQKTFQAAGMAVKPGDHDWRVRLSVPDNMKDSKILAPLVGKFPGFTFPYTPAIIINHTANYTANNPVHSNYPFNSYNYSSVDSIQINGDFYVQNSLEARHWVASIHYLRSVSKMRYGETSSSAGAPPPVVLFNGYGDFVFKDVPVVVASFQFDMQSNVDYIHCGITDIASDPDPLGDNALIDKEGGPMSWAPTHSQITVTLIPQYSRATVSQFNMDQFVNGDYIKGAGGGFI
jgi:hypothetical protein